MSRVYETVVVLLLLVALVFGLSWLLLDQDTTWGVCQLSNELLIHHWHFHRLHGSFMYHCSTR